jgi:hypothetical protein
MKNVQQGFGLFFASALVSMTAGAAAPGNDWEQVAAATAPYAAVRVIDTRKQPMVQPPVVSGWGTKSLWKSAGGHGELRILYVPPGAEGAYVHYHEFHEWAYNIAGDFTNNESTTPDNVSGPLQRFREGNFLSRPPYSLHGGEKGRMKFMMSQIGAEIMIMEEADVNAGSWTVDPAVRDGSNSQGMRFNKDYKKIQNWSTPRIIETIEKFPWQPVEGSPGLNVKYLIDDPSHGFRATMYFLEAGAKTPTTLRPYYYKDAHQFNFVINGDLTIDTYATPTAKAVPIKLTSQFFFDRPPMAVMGLPASGATRTGVVWLEVTYAKGERWTTTTTPIEAPTYLN